MGEDDCIAGSGGVRMTRRRNEGATYNSVEHLVLPKRV